MNKIEFLTELKMQLDDLHPSDVDAAIDYYSELIEEAMEAGHSSVSAVARLDSPEQIAAHIRATGIPRRAHASIHNQRESMYEQPKRQPKRKRSPLAKLLLCVGAPLWLILLLLLGILVLILTVVGFALMIVLYAVNTALAVVAAAGIFVSLFVAIIHSSFPMFLAMLGITLLAAGFSLILFTLSRKLTIQVIRLCKYLFHRCRAKFHERRLAA